MDVIHELGHSFGLLHSWYCQFTDLETTGCINGGWCNPQSSSNCSNNIMSYSAHTKWNITPLQLGKMHQRMFSTSNTKYLVHELDPAATINISDSEIWASARLIPGNVIISSGAKLTINCKVIMPPDSYIKVEKGGELIVDRGQITISSPECGKYWGGIIVEGNPNERQHNASEQGIMSLSDGALIEYANTAVVVQGGGRFVANNSTIKNCRYGVYFYPYTYPLSILSWFNFSQFTDVNFLVTDEHTMDVQPFVNLNRVSGIGFNNCHFNDLRSAGLSFSGHFSHFQSTGINSFNSNFRVRGEESEFSRLYTAISAGNNGSIKNFNVTDAYFDNCFGGIINRAVPGVTIEDNTFMMGGYDVTPINDESDDYPEIEWDGFGLSLQSASGFSVSGNSFTGDLPNGSDLKNTLGIYVASLGGAANKIENNSFSEVIIGNYAEGVNYDQTFNIEGLEYHCNSNDTGGGIGASYDFYVENGGGISSRQGRSTEVAGNTFRPGGFLDGNDFRNAIDANLLRYYHFNQASQTPTASVNVILFDENIDNGCLEEGTGTGGEILPEVIHQLKQNFESKKLLYESFLSQYLDLMDNGDMEDLKESIIQVGSMGGDEPRRNNC